MYILFAAAQLFFVVLLFCFLIIIIFWCLHMLGKRKQESPNSESINFKHIHSTRRSMHVWRAQTHTRAVGMRTIFRIPFERSVEAKEEETTQTVLRLSFVMHIANVYWVMCIWRSRFCPCMYLCIHAFVCVFCKQRATSIAVYFIKALLLH